MDELLDTAPCCYFSFTDDGQLCYVNQTLCTMLHYTKEELVDQKVETLFPIPTRIFHQTHFFPLLKMQGHAEEIFIFLKTKDNEQVPVLMNARRKEKEGVFSNHCSCIMVPNRKKFEDELVAAKKTAETALLKNTSLQQAKEELVIHMEKLDKTIVLYQKQNEELKQFNRVVTHDLQEPIRKFSIFSTMLQNTPSDSKQQQELMQKLGKVADQMRTVVSGLQQYVWLSESVTKRTPVNINALLLRAKKQLENEWNPGGLEIEMDNIPLLYADSDQLYVLFYQLLANALQYKKQGKSAHVKVDATLLKKNQFKALKDRYRYEDHLKLVITDNGIGFNPAYKEQVFELFKKLHNSSSKGLGLALCKMVVENHNGTIEADSQPGVGTKITLFLPFTEIAEPSVS